MLKFFYMLLDAWEDLAQLGNGLGKTGRAQHEMQQSQAGQRSQFYCSTSHSAILKRPGHSAAQFFLRRQFEQQGESTTNFINRPSSRVPVNEGAPSSAPE